MLHLLITLLANLFVIKVVKSMILIELIGIRIAATTGSKFPVTAKNVPIQLYNRESTKLILITCMVFLLRARKCGSFSISEACRIASQAGEKVLLFSATAQPTWACLRAPASFSPSPSIITCLPSFCNCSI